MKVFEIKSLIARGGFLNLETIFKISDLANFLPNLNNVNSFLIIIFSNLSELLQFLQISFCNCNFQIYLFSLDQLILLD